MKRKKNARIFIGTSGWNYKHWKGIFYPEGLKDADEFAYYQKFFKTVEINSSFYHLPKAETFANWRKKTPKDFLFSVKGSRYITHNKKLITDDDSVEHFLDQASKLKEKLGPILFQLPPGWKLNLARLEEFLSKLPKRYRYTFELRNHTWFDPQVYDLLKKYNCALCIYDLEYFFSPVEVTADFVYIRFHGPETKYAGNYTSAFLKSWAKKILKWRDEGLDVFVYFDNDQNAYAVGNAKKLLEYTK